MKIRSWFTLNESDLGRQAFLFPAFYSDVTWFDVAKMNLFVKLCLWIGNLGIIAAAGFGIFMSILVFYGDPKRSFTWGGEFGFGFGVLITFIAVCFIKAQAKLTYLLVKGSAK